MFLRLLSLYYSVVMESDSTLNSELTEKGIFYTNHRTNANLKLEM